MKIFLSPQDLEANPECNLSASFGGGLLYGRNFGVSKATFSDVPNLGL